MTCPIRISAFRKFAWPIPLPCSTIPRPSRTGRARGSSPGFGVLAIRNANATFPNASTLNRTLTHKYQAAGKISIPGQPYRFTSKDGCIADTVKTFTVNGSFPMAGFTVGNAATLCSNQAVTLVDGSSVTPGNIIRVRSIGMLIPNDPTIKTIDSTPAPGRQYQHAYPDFSSSRLPKSFRDPIRCVYSGDQLRQPNPAKHHRQRQSPRAVRSPGARVRGDRALYPYAGP